MDNMIEWLLEGDVSVQYMTHRFLLNCEKALCNTLQSRIETEGFGASFLSRRSENGHWGRDYYMPKWTCTHYTLTDLKALCIPASCKPCREMVSRAFDECASADGSIDFSKTKRPSDICVNGMFLSYAAYFRREDKRIEALIDFLLSAQKPDGGFAWTLQNEASDPHTAIAVLEGFLACRQAGIQHRLNDINQSESKCIDYLFENKLFMEQGDKRFLMLTYPWRYRYDILRGLDYFAKANVPYDQRMKPALCWLRHKKEPGGPWHLENKHKGAVHFEPEQLHAPSRFITLKALCIENKFGLLP